MKPILLQVSVEEFIAFIFALVVAIGLFLAIRGIVLWYWKVDTIVKNQEETNHLLRAMVRTLESKNDSSSSPKE